MMDEELTAHEVEGKVMNCPDDEEETGRVPKTVSNIYEGGHLVSVCAKSSRKNVIYHQEWGRFLSFAR